MNVVYHDDPLSVAFNVADEDYALRITVLCATIFLVLPRCCA